MKPSLKRISAIGLAIATVAFVAAAGPSPAAKAKIGAAAPAWELKDLEGKTHKLADFKGKTVVLEWFNPGCPWCVKVYKDGVVKETLDAMKEMEGDYVYLAVNSTGNIPKERVVEQSTELLKANEIKVPVLVDHDGKIGKRYGARTTPHMYVIDKEGVVRYMGAYADRQDMRGNNYVITALKQIAAGETVAPDTTQPWGCSVKYKTRRN